MSVRHRLGVALMAGPPLADELNGLRRALGDSSVGRIGPHVTLVPPVNVKAADLAVASAVVRKAAHGQPGPLDLVLGPVRAFLPVSPVLYLAVSGPGASDLACLQAAVHSGPLDRTSRWPWEPHLTVADDVPEATAQAALGALHPMALPFLAERVVLLEELDHRWSPLDDACLGPPAVVGRGGRELEITEGQVLGPEAAALLELEGLPRPEPMSGGLVLTARTRGRLAGLAVARAGPPGAPLTVGVLVATSERGQGTGRALLVALAHRAAQRGWSIDGARAVGPGGFYASCCDWARGAP